MRRFHLPRFLMRSINRCSTCSTDRLIEPLEPRCLLSAAPTLIPGAVVYDVTQSITVNGQTVSATPNSSGNDDAVAINAWIAKAVQEQVAQNGSNTRAETRIIYLPEGVYDTETPIVVPPASNGNSYRGIWFFGEGDGSNKNFNSIIRLKTPSQTGGTFADANNPRGVIEMIPYNGSSNNAFNNYVTGLRIEVRDGHDGAVGLVYASSNYGAVRDVTIRELGNDGFAGLIHKHQNGGPGLFDNVEVVGFDTGIGVFGNPSQMTLKDITVRNQNAGGQGILVDNKAVAIEDLSSFQDQRIPAIRQISQQIDATSFNLDPGQITLIDGDLRYTGSSSNGGIAIDNQAGHLYLRDVRTTKYNAGQIVRDHGVNRGTNRPEINSGGDIINGQEYVSVHGKIDSQQNKVILNLNGTPKKSLQLNIQDTPDFTDWGSLIPGNYTIVDKNDLNGSGTGFVSSVQNQINDNEWVIVDSLDAVFDSNLVQAALNSGARYVALTPHQKFIINKPLTINAPGSGGAVEFFYGQGASIQAGPSFDKGQPNDDAFLFTIETGSANRLIVQGWTNSRFIRVDGGSNAFESEYGVIQNNSDKTVVFKDLKLNQTFQPYRSKANGGTTFFENVTLSSTGDATNGGNAGAVFNGGDVYARAFNLEHNIQLRNNDYSIEPHIVNNGSDLWIFGQKVGEANGVYYQTTGGGRTEVLGGFLNNLWNPQTGGIAPPSANPNSTQARNFEVTDGEMSMVAIERLRFNQTPHATFGRIQQSGVDTIVENADLPTRRNLSGSSEFTSTSNTQQRVVGLLRGKSSGGGSTSGATSALIQAEDFTGLATSGNNDWRAVDTSGVDYAWVPTAASQRFWSNPDTAPRMSYTLSGMQAGTYDLKVRGNGNAQGSSFRGNNDSFYIRVNGSAWQTVSLGGPGSWTTRTFRDLVTLTAGKNLIEIAAREDGTQIDWFEFT